MQVLHGERSLYNARGGWDLARFLADPDRDDVEAHLANLRCAPGPGRVVVGLWQGHGRAVTGVQKGLRQGKCGAVQRPSPASEHCTITHMCF